MLDYQKLLSGKIQEVKPSGIQRFFDIVEEMDGVISLGIGEPDFATPWHIRNAGIYSLEKGRTAYTANSGISELRGEIASYLKRRFTLEYDPKSEVLVTVGGSEAIDACIRALVEDGDEVIIPEPCFVCYLPITTLSGGVPVVLETRAEDEFRVTPDALRSCITPRTKLLILPYPNNPTGAVMHREDLEAVAEVLRGTDIMVLSDEIYGELTYGGSHVSIASLEGMRERTVVVNGFSKAYAMTGWRLGYACGPAPVIAAMNKVHQYAIMCAPTTSQYAAIEAIRNGDEDVKHMTGEYDMRRKFLVSSLRRMGLSCFEPLGAFYVFPCIRSSGLSSEEFCERLLYEKKVALVPGTAFGGCGEGFVRISYAYSIKHIAEALRRIEDFLVELTVKP
ncbi:MAG: aminotransferase class I/II-fold pyridoxal phosphate-dependent enzyme [Clostridia bacterium]|nr:aminotransferase class I/II-fold pyridoxal phosphate-dependent enzyme [Clostridia bacterium]